ncbi:MAG: hypothetical protein ACKO38_05055 [Planctomycetota bacterium]
MFKCRLRLRFAGDSGSRDSGSRDSIASSPAPLRGLFFSGNTADRWLEAICRLTDDHDSIRLYSWSLSATGDRATHGNAAGVFVILRGRPGTTLDVPALAFRSVSARLWIPEGAELEPRVDAAFIEQSLAAAISRSEVVVVWHPALGLFHFYEDEAQRLDQVLSLPPTAPSRWDAASPGVFFPQRLTAIRAGSPPNWETTTREQGPGSSGPGVAEPPKSIDVGTKSSRLSELPSLPGEQPPGLRQRMVGDARRRAFRIVHALTNRMLRTLSALGRLLGGGKASQRDSQGPASQPPRRASKVGGSSGAASHERGAAGLGRNWLEQLRDWTQGRLAAETSELADKRDREIQRLLALLQNDPDQGLDYAIPLTPDSSGRGVAPPSDRLSDWKLEDRSSGATADGPADRWVIHEDARRQLDAKYRELARREVSLRRYRRAAKLYATLLGDWDAAARTLETGGHFREAGEILRDRLNRPADAARCFRLGGLFEESLAVWRQLKQHVEAGDMLRTLDREAEAVVEYRLAVEQLCVQGNPTAAADLLLEKLHQPDEALALLARSWPYGIAARSCFTHRLKMLQTQGRADALLALLRGLPDDPAVPQLGHWPLEAIAPLATAHPHQEIRDTARDVVLVLAGRQLAAAANPSREAVTPFQFLAAAGQPATIPEPSELKPLLGIVESLTAGDWLLKRDCQRFGEERRRATPQPAPAKKAIPSKTDGVPRLSPAARRMLDATVEWCWAGRLPYDPTAVCAIARDEAGRLSLARWPLPVENVGGHLPELRPLRLPRTSAILRMVTRIDNARAKQVAVLVLDNEAAARGAVSNAGQIETANADSFSLDGGPTLRVIQSAPGLYDYFWGRDHRYALIGVTNDVVLKKLNGAGEIVHSMSLALPFDQAQARDSGQASGTTGSVWRVAEVGRQMCVAHGRRVLLFSPAGGVSSEHLLGSEIHSITLSMLARVCFGLKQGAVLQWLENRNWKTRILNETMTEPIAKFLPSGLFVLAASSVVEVHDPNAGKVGPVSRSMLSGDPVAIVTLANREFAVLTRQGEWLRYLV